MFGHRMRLVIAWTAMSLAILLNSAAAETWHFEKGDGIQPVTAQDKYLVSVSQLKQKVETGKTSEVGKAYDQLKKDFPEIAGPDLEEFIKADMLYAKGSLTKASKAYEKFLDDYPESNLSEAALERQFAIGTAFLNGQKKPVLWVLRLRSYDEGVKIMERITDRTGSAPIGVRASLAIANSYEKRGLYNEAYHQWSLVSAQWPTGQIGKDALLAMARCKHAAYKGPKYDASGLPSAKTYYQGYATRYGEDAKFYQIPERIEQINEQDAYKHFCIGQYYQQTGNHQSAFLYYNLVLDGWPESTAAKMTKNEIARMEEIDKKGKTWHKNLREKLGKIIL